ncbi:hypothetical protein [Cytobacillus oceanisediminis]|jgi:hypothetical protein|uniref:hypothetical protein n=1 Tax=Cytobacillus oceanisediminis TaxID=665099 RepID=UPI001C238517|nr:hypothetical protein [Cytobacillus oceanisediminis]MBU8732336.1 hypothetical protein [Cytobacillus oceanisediminis]MDK7666514.1 hypothetical protein [Cytobacillus oceanisediminis]
MAKIKSPNPNYNGNSASLQFVNGEAETENKWLLEWFKNRGYKVEKLADEPVENKQNEDMAHEEEPKKSESIKKSGKTKAKDSDDKKDD